MRSIGGGGYGARGVFTVEDVFATEAGDAEGGLAGEDHDEVDEGEVDEKDVLGAAELLASETHKYWQL